MALRLVAFLLVAAAHGGGGSDDDDDDSTSLSDLTSGHPAYHYQHAGLGFVWVLIFIVGICLFCVAASGVYYWPQKFYKKTTETTTGADGKPIVKVVEQESFVTDLQATRSRRPSNLSWDI